MKHNPDGSGLTFTAPLSDVGPYEEVLLKPGGDEIEVTSANKDEYITLWLTFKLRGRIEAQLTALAAGFYSLIPVTEIQNFTVDELGLLICGVPEITFSVFSDNCDYVAPYTANHSVIKMFFQVISAWSSDDLAKLLHFITGSSRLAVRALTSYSNTRIKIGPGPRRELLPSSHTCVNRLDLPEYETAEEMSAKLFYAIHECNTFGQE